MMNLIGQKTNLVGGNRDFMNGKPSVSYYYASRISSRFKGLASKLTHL